MNPYRDNVAPKLVRIDAGEYEVQSAFHWESKNVDGTITKQGWIINLQSGEDRITLCDKASYDELSKKQGRRVRLIIEAEEL